ncbi:hypothetical protein BT69DRAFT_1344167 [Atractiella rhizophila]|nr:hypothetical protein BT69DRAFT_1344167 [Atractiella rhizophila]
MSGDLPPLPDLLNQLSYSASPPVSISSPPSFSSPSLPASPITGSPTAQVTPYQNPFLTSSVTKSPNTDEPQYVNSYSDDTSEASYQNLHHLLSFASTNTTPKKLYITSGNSLLFSIGKRRFSTSLSARSVILVNANTRSGSSTHPVTSPSPEISAVKIDFPPLTFIFVNIYNAADLMSETLNTLNLFIQQLRREYASIENFLLYVGGDFNLHHNLWNQEGYFRRDPKTDDLLERLTEEGLELRSEQGIITWAARESQTVIDLVFLNTEAEDLVEQCITSHDPDEPSF